MATTAGRGPPNNSASAKLQVKASTLYWPHAVHTAPGADARRPPVVGYRVPRHVPRTSFLPPLQSSGDRCGVGATLVVSCPPAPGHIVLNVGAAAGCVPGAPFYSHLHSLRAPLWYMLPHRCWCHRLHPPSQRNGWHPLLWVVTGCRDWPPPPPGGCTTATSMARATMAPTSYTTPSRTGT